MSEGAPDPSARRLLTLLSDWPAEAYVGEILIPSLAKAAGCAQSREAVALAIDSAQGAFRILLGHYAVSRRGHDRDTLSTLYLRALSRTLGDSPFDEFLDSQDADALWQSFEEICLERKRRVLDQVNRPVLEGLSELTFDVYAESGDGSLINWIVAEIRATHELEDVFNRLTTVRTFGPKAATNLLRDVVYLSGIEEQINYSNRLYLMPISAAARKVAQQVLSPNDTDGIADWVLAGKLAKACRLGQVSVAAFSLGISYLGARLAPTEGGVDNAIRSLVSGALD